MAADRDGTLWIGTMNGLVRWRNGAFARISLAEGLPAKQIRALLLDSKGTLWVSVLFNWLFQGDNGRFVPTPEAPFNADSSVFALLEDRDGSIWAGAESGYLWRWHDGVWQSFGPANGLPRAHLESLAQDSQGGLWVGSRTSGPYWGTNGRFQQPTNVSGFLEASTSSLCLDREGALWAGAVGGGLRRLSRRAFHYWGPAEGLPQTRISSVAEDTAGNLWVATENDGVYYSDGSRFSPMKVLSGNYPYVYATLPDAAGGIWAAGESILLRFRAGHPVQPYLEPPLRGDAINALCRDGSNLWLGTSFSALIKFDGTTAQIVATNGSFGGRIMTLAREAPETLWIGSYGGLYRWERGSVRRWTTRDGLLCTTVQALHRDPDGTLWAGTMGGGLARLKHGRIANITSKQGLIDDVISQILPDDLGHLWLGCNHGLMRLERTDLEACADGTAHFVYPLVLDEDDGMGSEECSSSHSPAATKTKSGWLLFPTARGIIEVDPGRWEAATNAAPLASIEELVVDGRSQTLAKSAVLAPAPRRLEVSYTAPNLLGAEKMRFRYRLEPVERDWINAGTSRTAVYVALPPGQYLFRLSASRGNGVWSETPASLAIVVQPRFWQTRWFEAVGLALIFGFGGTTAWRLAHRRHQRELGDLERTRARQAEMAHLSRVSMLGELSGSLAHELNQPLTAILSNAQAAQRFLARDGTDINEIREILDDIVNEDQRAGEVIRRLRLLFQKGEAMHQPLDVNEVVQEAMRLMRGDVLNRGVTVQTELTADLPTVLGDRVQLQQVILNLLMNACDAMRETRVDARRIVLRTARAGAKNVCVSLTDSGHGLPPEPLDQLFQPFFTTKAQGMGLGLSICRTIITAHRGKLWADRNPAERGATFHFTLPIAEAE